MVPDNPEGWAELGGEIGLPGEDLPILGELAREVLVEDISQAKGDAGPAVISFDDQIYCSTMLGGRFNRFPVVLVDEDQDLSPLNIRMLGQSLGLGGRIVAVGDKRQAIYQWRGAAGDSAERIRRLVPGGEWTDLPLMTTFRCPKAVVARQQGHVPGFRAWEGNPVGRVDRWERLKEGDPQRLAGMWAGWGWKELSNALPHPRASLAVLCRNNSPLVRFAIKLIKQGIGVEMLGRDIGKGLVQLASRLSKGEGPGMSMGRFVAALEGWEAAEWTAAGSGDAVNERKKESATDRKECLLAIAEGGGCRTAGDVVAGIKRVFEAEGGLVTLSSIHRAKGAEWDCVLHLDPWRVPSKAAKRAAMAGNPIPLEQEWNLRYVAETRTRHTLLLADLTDFNSGEPQ